MKSKQKKCIEVGCAIIEKHGKILIAQRRPGDFLGGYWEFPGGKRRDHEDMKGCLEREVREELGFEIVAERFLFQMYHSYFEKDVLLDFYLCRWVLGEPSRQECLDFAWIDLKDLRKYQMIPADTGVIHELIEKKAFYFRKF